MPKNNEATVNYELAKALQDRHPLWRGRIGAEQHGVLEQAILRPDIVVNQPGRPPIILETEFAPASGVLREARARLGQIVHESNYAVEQSLAVQLPVGLRDAQGNLRERVETARFRWRALSLPRQTEADKGPDSPDPGELETWPPAGWITGTVDDLANTIECLALSERLLEESLALLERSVRHSARVLREEALPHAATSLEKMAQILHQQDSEQTSRMAMAIVANAFSFQQSLVGIHTVPSLQELKNELGFVDIGTVLDAWRKILREINYWPIFKIASDLLRVMRPTVAGPVLGSLTRVAERLSTIGATSMHDLSGRMFQRLIVDRKFLATFYTLPNSATLLAELAVARLPTDWARAKRVSELRIADLACGTGALLSAAYQAIRIRHRRAGGDDAKLHRAMMERALIAADIMPAATHLTASSLSSAHPSLPFGNTQVYTMPYGQPSSESGRLTAIGSLDLIQKETTSALFGTGEFQARGDRKDREAARASLPELRLPHDSVDLIIMNPPFTRPTNHESATVPVPSFAGFGTSEDEQKKMAARLKAIKQERSLTGSGNAGLASYFFDLAHMKVRPGGVVALVLPASFAQGASWEQARRVLEREYQGLTVICIATGDLEGQAFSADTGMAEVLLVATKRDQASACAEANGRTLFVSLFRRPSSVLEAHEIARQIERLGPQSGTGRIRIGDQEEVGAYRRSTLADSGSALVREPEIAETMTALGAGQLRLQRMRSTLAVPMTELDALGSRGVLDRDISGQEKSAAGIARGPFELARIQGVPAFPILWGHDAARERCLVVPPDREGRVREGCREKANAVWERAGTRLHFNRDFRVNSQSLAACLTSKPAIGGTAWPSFRLANEDWEETVALWANSTLGLMSFWWIGSRQQLGRARLTISRLPKLAVLDPRSLTESQIRQAKTLFREFQARPFRPANEAYRCDARRDLDRAILVELLAMPAAVLDSLDLLRAQWCAEPTVHGGKSTRIPPTGDG